jgi:hypothetical protein
MSPELANLFKPPAYLLRPYPPTWAAARISLATWWDETGEAWLERTSTVVAPMWAAMNRSRSGLIIRSRVETRNHDRSVRHVGGPAGSVKLLAAMGFCTAARTRASPSRRSWAKLAGIAARSSHRKPSESGCAWARPGGDGSRDFPPTSLRSTLGRVGWGGTGRDAE